MDFPGPEEMIEINISNGAIINLNTFIGRGSHSRIWKGTIAERESQKLENVAIKLIWKPPELSNEVFEDKVLREYVISQKMAHPNLLKINSCYYHNGNAYLILELCEGGTLNDLMKTKKNELSLLKKLIIFEFIARGLDMLHSGNPQIIHRDIKPSNIMFQVKDDLSSLKIIDFGYTRIVEEKNATVCGTSLYMAPEMITSGKCKPEIDAWSFGVLIYEVLFGKHPFIDKCYYPVSPIQVLGFISKELSLPKETDNKEEVPEFLAGLILKILQLDGSARPKISEILKKITIGCFEYMVLEAEKECKQRREDYFNSSEDFDIYFNYVRNELIQKYEQHILPPYFQKYLGRISRIKKDTKDPNMAENSKDFETMLEQLKLDLIGENVEEKIKKIEPFYLLEQESLRGD